MVVVFMSGLFTPCSSDGQKICVAGRVNVEIACFTPT